MLPTTSCSPSKSLPSSTSVDKQNARSIKESRKASFDPLITLDIRCRRTFSGHISKIFSGGWLSNSDGFVSAAQDGKLIFWNAYTGEKTHMLILKSLWVMSCGISQDAQNVCVGGLESLCHIYKRNPKYAVSRPDNVDNEEYLTNYQIMNEFQHVRTLEGHLGYVSGCKFFPSNQNRIVTVSGDATAMIWDVNRDSPIQILSGDHSKDISSLSIADRDSFFVTGSFDGTCSMYDSRNKCKNIGRIRCSSEEVNNICLSSSGDYLVTGSADSHCKLFDLRWTESPISSISAVKSGEEVSTVALSLSGRYLFCAGLDPMLYVWDLVTGSRVASLEGHNNRISFIDISPNGYGLLTGSWDKELRLWLKYT